MINPILKRFSLYLKDKELTWLDDYTINSLLNREQQKKDNITVQTRKKACQSSNPDILAADQSSSGLRLKSTQQRKKEYE